MKMQFLALQIIHVNWCGACNKLVIFFLYRITELYLQNNDLSDISGTLSHLRNLQVLMLQKNQLPDLNGTLQEIKSLLALRFLSKFKTTYCTVIQKKIKCLYPIARTGLSNGRTWQLPRAPRLDVMTFFLVFT